MSDIRQPLYGTEARKAGEALRIREAVRRTGVPHGHVRAEITGHGQYQCTAKALDALLERYWDTPVSRLYEEIKDEQGDPYYETDGLTKVEAIMILAELRGHATN